MLFKNEDIPCDYKESEKYLQMAYTQRPIDATYYLTQLKESINMMKFTSPIKYEITESYKKLADVGYTKAIYSYAYRLYNGFGIDENRTEAAKLFKIAADKGSKKDIYKYGRCLDEGKGIPIDKDEAIKYFKIGASKGSLDCINYLIYIYRDDKKEAAKYYQMAADTNDKDSVIKFCDLLATNEVIAIDLNLHMKYFKKAIEFGHFKSGNVIGEVLYYGVNNEPINKEEATKWFKMMADKGYGAACYNYGRMLFLGYGIPINKKDLEGLKDLEKAASLGGLGVG